MGVVVINYNRICNQILFLINYDSFLESFNLYRLLLIIALYYQIKTQIDFWFRQKSNPDFLGFSLPPVLFN